MSDKIAEHIAKFNAPPNAVFYWVSCSKCGLSNYIDSCNLLFLMLKIDDNNWKSMNGEGMLSHRVCSWTYTLKHEPKQEKGEIMKSIELSEEELLTKKERKTIQECLQIGFNKGKIPYLSGDALCKKLDKYLAENAKPIEPIVQKWSEEEIRGALTELGWVLWVQKDIFKLLKTPKPVMRDRTTAEIMMYMIETGIDLDKCDYNTPTYKGVGYPNKATHYRVECKGDWLPIPQIEKEK